MWGHTAQRQVDMMTEQEEKSRTRRSGAGAEGEMNVTGLA
jgi:hypothetical protein